MLNWMTSGIFAESRPLSLRFCLQVRRTAAVLPWSRRCGVRDEGDAVGALEHEPAGGVVDDLTGHREELHAHRQPAPSVKLRGSRSKNSVRSSASRASSGDRGRPRDELVERLQVRRLTAQRRPVVDELDRQLARGEVELQSAPGSESFP